MSDEKQKLSAPAVVQAEHLQNIIELLNNDGFDVCGPTIRDRAVVYDHIRSVQDLPIGYTDQQENGSYRLNKGKRQHYFRYNLGPNSWKRFLYPPEKRLLHVSRDGSRLTLADSEVDPPKYAFVGVRPCELAAMSVHDRVLTEGEYRDPWYQQVRRQLLMVAVNCTRAGGTCFCSSMKTGPEAESGFDLALTEVLDKKDHYFVVRTGTEAGEKILEAVPNRPATEDEINTAGEAVQKAASAMGRKLDTEGLSHLLKDRFDSPHWEELATRCLTCGNCTMVCPTCFCADMEDSTDLGGDNAYRARRWDSCFRVGFSYIHGGSIRSSEMSRYRQWMMHKLAYWPDQFGSFGCIGCGRCITWCPVGIDITEEARLIRENG